MYAVRRSEKDAMSDEGTIAFLKRFTVFAVSVCGMHRPVNEDNIFINGFYKKDVNVRDVSHQSVFGGDEDFVVAVCDGMGGQNDGEIASLEACAAMSDMAAEDPGLMIKAANDAVCRYNEENGSDSGSTCVLLEYRNGRFRSWNVGDSRAYRICGHTAVQLSVDHTERSRFEGLGGSGGTASGNRLTQHLGIDSEDFIIEPYVSEWITPDTGDMFLLCSDGLTGAVEDDEIAQAAEAECGMQEKALALLKMAADKGSTDNISVILISEDAD